MISTFGDSEEPRPVQSYRDLKVWRLGMDISEQVYRLTKEFPKEERYGITSQMRRAATSVPANVAEGNARDSTKDYLRHLSIAVGSLAEVETFLELASRLGYCHASQVGPIVSLLGEQRRMLRGLQRSLRKKLATNNP